MDSVSPPCISCGGEVRPQQHALNCVACNGWQHRLCKTGKYSLSYKFTGTFDVKIKCIEDILSKSYTSALNINLNV